MKDDIKPHPYQVKYTQHMAYMDQISIEKKILKESAPIHWHEFCELELVIGGEGIQRKKGTPMSFSKGVLSLQLPMDFHEVIVNGNNPPILYSVKFAEKFITPKLYQEIFNNIRNHQITLSSDLFNAITNDFELMWQESHKNSIFKELIMRNILEKIVIIFYRIALEELKSESEFKKDVKADSNVVVPYTTLFDCLNYIQNNYQKNITLKELADGANMSPNYFSAYFKQNTGCTIRYYLKRTRIRHAISFLSQTDLPIARVGEMVGLPTYDHFNKLFTKEIGISPREFRKQMQEKV